MNRDEAEETVRIPVQILSNGTVAMESGARLPLLRAGTFGDLVVPAASLANQGVVAALNELSSTQLLAKDEVVWIRLYPPTAPVPPLESFEKEALHPQMVGHYFAPITLGSVLKLVTRGTKRGQLERTPCSVPAGEGGKDVQATSLNHAYRLLSQRFEPHRVSFGGNIFDAAFVKREGKWHRLEALRRAAESTARKKVDRAIEAIEAGGQGALLLGE